MARMAVVHPDFSVTGGAEAVSMNVLEALQNDHDVTLLTARKPEFDDLNDYYNTNVSDVSVVVPAVSSLLQNAIGNRLRLLRYAVLNRAIHSRVNGFDLVIGTYNELAVDGPSLTYVHHPLYRHPEQSLDAREVTGSRRLYTRGCAAVAVATATRVRDSTIVANSGWMADVVAREYNADLQTVYPPVGTDEFHPPPHDQKELGFVSIGRLAPDKHILRNIEIIARVRDRGHDVHLHLIGPPHQSDYYSTVVERADRFDFIHLEAECSRPELVEIVENHRYGLHGKENEHFGIVVAELLAGGAVPFVPNSGGQREIVVDRPELLYDSIEDAIEKVDRLLSDSSLENEVRAAIPSIEDRFGRTRFHEEIRTIVDDILDVKLDEST